MGSKNPPGKPIEDHFDHRSKQPWINPGVVGIRNSDISSTPYEEARHHLLTHPDADRLAFVEHEVSNGHLSPMEGKQVITLFPLEPKELGKVVEDIYATFQKEFCIQLPRYDVTFGPPNMCTTDYQGRKILFPRESGLDLVSDMAFHLGLIHHWEHGAIYHELKAAPKDSALHTNLRAQSSKLIAGFAPFCMWLYANARDERIKTELHTLSVHEMLNDPDQAGNLEGFKMYMTLSDSKSVKTALKAGLELISDTSFEEFIALKK